MNGLIVINKHKGITSQTAVSKVKRLFKIKKAGHFGTLDPMAEGVLLVALGKATRFFDFYIKSSKYYTGLIHFGFATDTYDAEGEAVSDSVEVDLTSMDIPSLKEGLIGEILQYPPKYSAKKKDGKPLYKYARENVDVEIKPSKVTVNSFETEVRSGDTLWFRIGCSSGTYIRSIAHDMGQKAGVGAHLKELNRTASGEFTIDKAYKLSDLESMSREELEKAVVPIDRLLTDYPGIVTTESGVARIMNGMEIAGRDVIRETNCDSAKDIFRLLDENETLLAFARKDLITGAYHPYLVIKPD